MYLLYNNIALDVELRQRSEPKEQTVHQAAHSRNQEKPNKHYTSQHLAHSPQFSPQFIPIRHKRQGSPLTHAPLVSLFYAFLCQTKRRRSVLCICAAVVLIEKLECIYFPLHGEAAAAWPVAAFQMAFSPHSKRAPKRTKLNTRAC